MASVRRVTTPKVPPPPPRSAKNRSGSRHRFTTARAAVRGDHLGLEQVGRAGAECLGKAAEAAALHETRHAHGEATAALHVASVGHRDGVVHAPPDGARTDRDRLACRRSWRRRRRHERVMHLDAIQRARPDEQRIGRVGVAEVAVAATLHHEADSLCPCEGHRRGHVVCRLGAHGVSARARDPGAGPAERLCESWLVAEVVRVLQPRKQ